MTLLTKLWRRLICKGTCVECGEETHNARHVRCGPCIYKMFSDQAHSERMAVPDSGMRDWMNGGAK